jgi:hypothetical protein
MTTEKREVKRSFNTNLIISLFCSFSQLSISLCLPREYRLSETCMVQYISVQTYYTVYLLYVTYCLHRKKLNLISQFCRVSNNDLCSASSKLQSLRSLVIKKKYVNCQRLLKMKIYFLLSFFPSSIVGNRLLVQ